MPSHGGSYWFWVSGSYEKTGGRGSGKFHGSGYQRLEAIQLRHTLGFRTGNTEAASCT